MHGCCWLPAHTQHTTTATTATTAHRPRQPVPFTRIRTHPFDTGANAPATTPLDSTHMAMLQSSSHQGLWGQQQQQRQQQQRSGRRHMSPVAAAATPDAGASRSRLVVPSQPLQQQQRLCSDLPVVQSSSSHRRLLPALQARRRSPVIAPDITVGRGEEQGAVDLFNYLLRQRIIFLAGYVNDKMATQIVGSLLALEAMDEEAPIRMYINSPGGQPYSIIGVADAMTAIKPPIQTVALGACYSYSSLLLAAGTRGQRFSMKNTRIMMTQPMGGSQGDIYAIAATVRELNAIYQLFCKYYMKFTDMSPDEVEAATCRDTFMTPELAQEAGLIDGIYAADDDNVTPPAVVRNLQDLGLVDRLSGGVLSVGRSGR